MKEQLIMPSTGFLRLKSVLQFIPVSRSQWWKGINTGKYPKPIKLGVKTTAWRVEDITEVIQRLSKPDYHKDF